jgi:hypothetical protein
MPKTKEGDDEKDETYYPHLKQEINFNLIYDTTIYSNSNKGQQPNPLIQKHFAIDRVLGFFDPILYVSDFWHMQRDLVIVDDESVERMNKVRGGEEQEGEEGAEDFELRKLNFAGDVKFTFSNYNINYLGYQE